VDVTFVATAAILHHDFAERALADPGFQARSRPVAAEALTAEGVGPSFLDYLGENWDDIAA
jgi:hypothetical protein